MRSLKLYLIAGAVLLAIYIVAKINEPQPIDWTETLSSKDKIPFGTYVFSNRIGDIFPGAKIVTYRQPVYNAIAEDSIKKSTYIIITEGIQLSKIDYTYLTKYIKEGNDVFIAAEYFGDLLEKKLNVETRGNFPLNHPKNEVDFLSPALNPKKHFSIDKGVGNYYFSDFDTLHTVVIGEDTSHKANLIKYSFGKGNLYLCANPRFFSNYSMLKPDGAAYAATALSFLKNSKQVILDEYYTQGNEGAETPLRVFLSNPALEWAWYIALLSLLIFVLYEMKRRQRIIPVIEPLGNSTLDFVGVVGRVYYEKRNNADIAQKKILYFLTWLRDEHQIKTNKLDAEFTERLIGKLGISKSFANDLVSYINYISVQTQVSDSELIELNKMIEFFYNQAR